MIIPFISAPAALTAFTSKLGPRLRRRTTRLSEATALPTLSAEHLLSVLHELTSEARRYSLAWFESGSADYEANASAMRMNVARNAVAEILFWRLTGVELPTEVQLERDRASYRFQLHEIQVITRELYDEALVWYAFGRRLLSDGTPMRRFERVRLSAARMWVVREGALAEIDLSVLPVVHEEPGTEKAA